MDYIATFFTHFGAISFKKRMTSLGVDCRLMPVPRKLSSSCGTCAGFTCDDEGFLHTVDDSMECVYRITGDNEELIYDAR